MDVIALMSMQSIACASAKHAWGSKAEINDLVMLSALAGAWPWPPVPPALLEPALEAFDGAPRPAFSDGPDCGSEMLECGTLLVGPGCLHSSASVLDFQNPR